MESVTNALRSLKLWQWAVLAVILAGAIGGVFGGYALSTGSTGAGLEENQQAVPVQYGTLTNDISINGSLVYPEKETLGFGSGGTVGEVLVEEGDQVQEGQVLARLDEAAIASLEKAIAQAEVNLRNAEEALAEARIPYSELDVATAEAKVANAQLSLQSAEEVLDGLLNPAEQQAALAEATVAGAKLSVQSVQDAFDEALDGASEEDINKARAEVDSAETSLANAQAELQIAEREWADRVEEAQEGFEAAQDDYNAMYEKWLGITLTDQEGLVFPIYEVEPEYLLDLWEVDLDSLFDIDLRFAGFSWDGIHLPPDDPATRWDEVTVYIWLNLYGGHLVPTCEDGGLTGDTVCIQQEFDDAWDSYQTAKNDNEQVGVDAAKAIVNTETAVTRAQDDLDSAQEAQDTLLEGIDPAELEDLQSQLNLAKANLSAAEENLADLITPDPEQVEAKRKQVEVERLSLVEAQDELAELLEGVDLRDITLREADVASAQVALDAAQQELDDAVLLAPMTGVIQVVNIEVGDTVGATTPVVMIADPSIVEVDGTVDEIDVLFMREGAAATVTMDALAGEVLAGTVSSISSKAQSLQGVVTYPISIRVDLPDGVQLVEGLSAVANVVINEEDGLLIPLQSVYGSYQQPMVQIVNGSDTEYREVVLGNSDDFWTVVQQGLSEGERVVMEVTEASSSTFSFRAGGMVPGMGAIGGGSKR
jgi:RND family efflux transporter MFP subunit